MKAAFVFITTLLACLPVVAQRSGEGGEFLLHRMSMAWSVAPKGPMIGVNCRFLVNRAELLNVPAWEPGDGKPPVARDDAVAIAREAAKARGMKGDHLRRVIVRLIRSNEYDDEVDDIPETACCWFYVCHFPDVQPQPTAEGFPLFLVTMGGELGRKVVEDWPQPKNRLGD